MVARWVENPYYQHSCGETFFQHRPPIDPSSLTRWRNRIPAGALREEVCDALVLTGRLLDQKPKDKNKIYSLHGPEVDCISKG